MALDRNVKELLGNLPWGLRTSIEGYCESLVHAWPQICSSAGVTVRDVDRDTFVLHAAIWKLWTIVDGQYWMIHNTINVLDSTGAQSFGLGRQRFSPRGDASQEVQALRSDLMKFFARRDLEYLLEVSGPAGIVASLAGRPNK